MIEQFEQQANDIEEEPEAEDSREKKEKGKHVGGFTMAEMSPEKIAAQEEATEKTEWERQRIEYYRSLRYDFNACDVDSWLDTLYEQREAKYKPQENPSWNQVRKEAGIGFFENAFAFLSKDKKKSIDAKKAEVKKSLQEEVDRYNAAEEERCRKENAMLIQKLEAKQARLTAHKRFEVESYFAFVLEQDSFMLDGNDFSIDFNLLYDSEKRQLIVDYKLPVMDQVPRVKEWRTDKQNDVVPKEMNKTDYLEMYERILFDLSVRTVGMLFISDTNNVLSSIVFNGYCVYNDWQKMPTVLISFTMPKDRYSYDKVRKMDFISKLEIAKLDEVRYLNDIHSQKAPTDLWKTPPFIQVVPIRSSF